MALHHSADPPTDQAKADLRRDALARRRGRSAAEIADARAAIAGHLLTYLAGRSTVAGYLPLATEPLDPDLPARLAAGGARVLLPVATAGAALNWAALNRAEPNGAAADAVDHAGLPAGIRIGSFGIPEPTGPLLGTGAIAEADAVLVPALLVDRAGMRLGRGGGHYDRTLVAATGELIAVVFDDELVAALPAGPHDVPVTTVVTPGGIRRLPGPG